MTGVTKEAAARRAFDEKAADKRSELAHFADGVHKHRMATVDRVLGVVRDECERAVEKFGPMNSPHEGYAVILEEVDELWDDVKANKGRLACAMAEAIQIAAMGVRYVADLDGETL